MLQVANHNDEKNQNVKQNNQSSHNCHDSTKDRAGQRHPMAIPIKVARVSLE